MSRPNVKIDEPGGFGYTDASGTKCSANFPLFLIRAAWNRGCDFEFEADGFGKGEGTCGDWSGIRDSSDEATEAMLEKALLHLNLI